MARRIFRRSARAVLLAFAALLLVALPRPSHAQVTRVGWTGIVSTRSGQCLDIRGASTQSGAVAEQSPCQATANEQWEVQPASGGVMIIGAQNAQCLTAAGSAVVQGACSGSGAVWKISVYGNQNAFKIASVAGGLCLTPALDSNQTGTAMTMATCTDATLATWAFQSGMIVPTQLTTLQAGSSGQCMMIGPAGTPTAGNLVQNPCAGTPAEQWYVRPTSIAYAYTIVFGTSGQCLTAASSTIGAAISPSACTARQASQLFSLTPATPGYQVSLAKTSLCLDVSAASALAGSQIVLAACNTVPNQLWSLSNATVPASWTGVIGLNNDPVGVANLPDGTLLTWSSNYPWTYEGDIGSTPSGTYTSIFYPATLTSGVDQGYTAYADMFCPGTANLADGRVMINGGSSSPRTTIYDPAAATFTGDANMNFPRGYEANTTLSNGSVLTVGGSWSGNNGGKISEIWTSGQGWKALPGVPETAMVGPDPDGIFRGDNHMWLFAFSNGIVLQAGPSAEMNWIFTSGSGAVYPAGTRGDDAYSINGDAVMYDVGKILKAGGAPAYDGGIATTAAYTINVNAAGLTVDKVAPMAYPRGFASGVALPSGQVLIVGGQTYTQTFTDTYAVLVPELWDPLTGVFRQLPPMQTPRTYHSTAILLNDGRVFVGGGGLCGYGCAQNHLNTEILTPPYLLNANGSAATRPVIKSAPATAAPGSTITVATNTPVTSFALMRNSSITHTVNNDQRRIPLAVQSFLQTGATDTYTLNIPADTGVTLPGYYMLFALNAYGVPSVAASILVH